MADIYCDYFGLDASPFNITPDPRFLYLSHRHLEAYNHLIFGIEQRKGFIQLTGEVGCGKSTLCRAMLEQLGDRYRTALILNPCLSDVDLIRTICQEFSLDAPPGDKVAALNTLNRFLLDLAAKGLEAVLVIDEAQDLSFEMLEEVRLLSNLETDSRKLLQIVLMGQPELREKLDDKRVRQLRQRITVRYHLEPLDRRETGEYVRHRLKTAGANGRPSFSGGALGKVYRYSHGIPRLVNAVCDKALLAGFVAEVDEIGRREVSRAIRELEGDMR